MNFWSLFERVECFPNCGCEPMIAGCIICQPVNFISSLPYFLVAIVLYLRHKNKDPEFYGWAVLMALVGLTSMFAHSSYIRVAMAMDYSSIIFLLTFFFYFDLIKTGPFKKLPGIITLPAYYLILMAVLMPLDIWSQYYVSLFMFAVALAHFFRKHGINVLFQRSVIISILIISVSMVFLLMDKDERFCNIRWLPYGHTLWHIGSALSAYFFGKWYFVEYKKVAL